MNSITAERKLNELRQLIIEGNKETDSPHLPSESVELYEYYWKQLTHKVEEITGVKIDFCYYTFY